MVGGPRILVVDDEPHIVQVLSLKLEPAGFDVLEAGDAEQAFSLAQRFGPDLIIADYVMPEADGLELCRWLRSDPALAAIPVLILTGMPLILPEPAQLCQQVVDVLTKPFSPRDLLLRVQSLLNQSAHASQAS